MISTTDSIRQILYISKATGAMSEAQWYGIASHARVKNERDGITGALLFFDGSFVQVIEGKAAAIGNLLASIRADKRHKDITIVMDREVRSRDFRNWSMGIITLSKEKNVDVVREIHSADKKDPPKDVESDFFADSQTFLMMKNVYQTNQALQQARGHPSM